MDLRFKKKRFVQKREKERQDIIIPNIFIRNNSTVTPTPLTDYKYLTGEEHRRKLEEEDNKGRDPCEKDMECMQDKEIRETSKDADEPNWEHKDRIPEAKGAIISPDRKWIPGWNPGQGQANNKDETKYDPLEALKQRGKRQGSNPVNIVTAVRTIKENKRQEKQERKKQEKN